MIEQWLAEFHAAWQRHDIAAVLELFSDEVEYWETPFRVLHSKEAIASEWKTIKNQSDIAVHAEVFTSSPDGKHAITWQLTYTHAGEVHELGGVYLIHLNTQNKCDYFYYVGEMK